MHFLGSEAEPMEIETIDPVRLSSHQQEARHNLWLWMSIFALVVYPGHPRPRLRRGHESIYMLDLYRLDISIFDHSTYYLDSLHVCEFLHSET